MKRQNVLFTRKIFKNTYKITGKTLSSIILINH